MIFISWLTRRYNRIVFRLYGHQPFDPFSLVFSLSLFSHLLNKLHDKRIQMLTFTRNLSFSSMFRPWWTREWNKNRRWLYAWGIHKISMWWWLWTCRGKKHSMFGWKVESQDTPVQRLDVEGMEDAVVHYGSIDKWTCNCSPRKVESGYQSYLPRRFDFYTANLRQATRSRVYLRFLFIKPFRFSSIS